MKVWIKKLAEQFEIEAPTNDKKNDSEDPQASVINDDLGTVVYILDVFQKNLIDVPNFPIRKTRETLDSLTKKILENKGDTKEENLFKFRNFFSTYRAEEISYFKNTFNDFKNLIWEFADNLKEELKEQKKLDASVDQTIKDLREAVESDSIEELRKKTKLFIQTYVDSQNKKETQKEKRLQTFKKNLSVFKKKLSDAELSLNTDFLTGAYNRRFFEEQIKSFFKLSEINSSSAVLLVCDIDFFKKINDNYGHDIGDFILKECVSILKNHFSRESEVVARMGGEEFAILLPDFKTENALQKVNDLLAIIRKQIFVHEKHQIKFTISVGLCEFNRTDSFESWYKKADQALYEAKNTGRDKVICFKELKIAV